MKQQPGIVQTWGCPKCNRLYESFLRVPFISCSDISHGGKPFVMKLVKGDPYEETEVKEAPRGRRAHPSNLPKVVVPSRSKQRPKVTRIDSGEELLKSLGLK